MLTELYNAVIDRLKSLQDLNGKQILKEVREYRGEFTENGEWNPVFPSAFVHMPAITVDAVSPEYGVLNYTPVFIIHIADEYNALNILDIVRDALESYMLEYTIDEEYFSNLIRLDKIELVGWFSRIQVYTIQFSLP
jgi:hypothetical protein